MPFGNAANARAAAPPLAFLGSFRGDALAAVSAAAKVVAWRVVKARRAEVEFAGKISSCKEKQQNKNFIVPVHVIA